ncbi:MAG TPA: hypothetical protein VE575_10655 [Acidimicrobiales bacterium]|jgi:hypothetical protein|nr:hypothetical protein [Acidimicrobiales bacterium]
MLLHDHIAKTLVDDRRRELEKQASRWSLARRASRNRHRQQPTRRAASAGL